ncbi:MAG TPA: hypothetical protein VFD58_21120 [Blastocatellia bacterium]|nr:hypothetical protein [Blastocatellia bacterium]
METRSLNEELIARYLLGDLPEEEQSRLEDLAFSDRECRRRIVAVESDLIDEYVRGELSEARRRQFERRFFASAGRRRKVEFARALARVVSATATEEVAQPAAIPWRDALTAFLRGLNPAFGFSMAAASLILLLGVSWLIAETGRLRTQVAQLQADQQTRQRQDEILRQEAASARARSEDLASRLERERGQRERSEELARRLGREQREKSAGSSFIASLFLPPGISRGGAERPKLVVPRATRLARLQIGLAREDEFKSFRVEIRTAAGQEVWTRDHLRPRQSRGGRIINLAIPGSVFGAGEYELTLKGVINDQKTEDVRYYYFSVLKE